MGGRFAAIAPRQASAKRGSLEHVMSQANPPRAYNVPVALACNIDKRGRIARLIYGVVLVATAVVLAFTWAMHTTSVIRWVVVVSCAVAGGFGIFEARKGWCAVRAMGFKTPM
jgi:hypothetical protein